MRFDAFTREYFEDQGYHINNDGGAYLAGKSYDFTKKVHVASVYNAAKEATGGRPNISSIARDCAVSRDFVRKIEHELDKYGRVLQLEERKLMRAGPRGPCTRTLTNHDMFILYQLYLDEPSRVRSSYVEWLYFFTGTVVSESTISSFFNKCFDRRGGLCRPNLVPFDKFRPENFEKLLEYISFIARVNPTRLKFGDEKLLKGQELYNRKMRRDVVTGVVPAALTSSDFRNTYALFGICGIDRRSPPVFCTYHEESNNAHEFALQLELAIASGWLHPGDILVLDNASIHSGGENSVLEEWMWEKYGICILFLPARSPELNPIEQVWKILVHKLKKVPLSLIRGIGANASIEAAKRILSNITHDEVEGCFRRCNYL